MTDDPIVVPAEQKEVMDKFGVSWIEGHEIRTFISENSMALQGAMVEYELSKTAVKAILLCENWSEPWVRSSFDESIETEELR